MVGYDPYVAELPGVELMELDDLLATADAVSLHSPLLPETRGMIGANQLGQMKPDAVLVNTSRGPLVVLDDLLDALRSGKIRGAGLDVYEDEPPDPERLAGVPGLLATPHSAFYSEAALAESQTKAATQVVKVLTDEAPDYQVN
jgi:D-3-phosphoglycerate dehydrogenase